tara:strand:+ start:11604 stop:11846 length:243 start_codon:yes stop_codon:yes gene_type:complete
MNGSVEYVAHIEWEAGGGGLDFWIWGRKRFDWIIEDLRECLDRGFSTATGSCPRAKVVSVERCEDGKREDVTELAFRRIS